MSEVRQAVTTLVRTPVFSALAVLSLALGIGANTAMFSLVDQVLLRLLPVEKPGELVQLQIRGGRFGSNNGDGVGTFSHPLYLALRDGNSVLSGLTGQMIDEASLLGDDRNEMISVGLVAGNFFDVLGVRAHRGRLLVPADDRVKNGQPVVVLQYDFWRNRFAADERLVGSSLRLNGQPFEVVGIAAPGFEGTEPGLPTQVFVPVTMKTAITPTWDELENERYAWFYLFGRLKPGVSLAEAQASLRVLYSQRQQQELEGEYFARYPDTRERFLKQTLSLVPASRGASDLRERFERPLLVLEWLVALVLLIACANVANLLLARGAARQREIAIRSAIGASRGRIVRQLMLESLLLAAAGGLLGLALSVGLARGLLHLLPYDPANLSLSSAPDLRVLAFTAAATLLTALAFGLVPALSAARIPPGTAMKQGALSVAGGRGQVRLRKVLVALQVGLATVLLIGSGLFVRSLQRLREVDLGFSSESVVSFGVQPATPYDEARKRLVFRELIEGLGRVPGVAAAGANSARLLTGGRWDSGVTIPGVGMHDGRYPWSYFNAITPGYFDALRIPVKAGRDLGWDDWDAPRERCLVNEALVREYLDGASPVGRLMAQGREQTPDMEIVGVFADAHYDNVRGTVPRQTFVSMGSRLRDVQGINVYVRASGDPRLLMPALRREVRRVDASLVVSDMRTLDAQLDRRLSNERMLSILSSAFAGLALVLAGVGLYGVLAFVVTRRTREIGIRMALGAERASVVRLVLGEMAPLVVLGTGAGVAAALAGARYVESQLFGVAAREPSVFAASASLLLLLSLVAGLLPARRAARIEPVHALRHE